MLTVITVLAYEPVGRNGFVHWDDQDYVVQNAHVQEGLTLHSVGWAFTSFSAANWHPLTWISHMADVHFFGLDPGAHHLSSLALHCLNVILVFLVLLRMTGALWRSFLVALLFAIHPLNVESVAWVAERKNVLSALFWLLTMWAYISYVQRPSAKSYLQVVLVFALGLMAKPTLVTEPFALLLLDFWPLRRWPPSAPSSPAPDNPRDAPAAIRGREDVSAPALPFFNLLREKIPLLALSLGSCLITIAAQRNALASLHTVSLNARLANAVTSYLVYLYRMVWPVHLAAVYPYPTAFPAWQTVAAIAVLSVLSAKALRQFQTQPYLAVGWFWYLGTLVPVIGLVQVGLQANADRYVYIPFIGIFVALVWWLGDWTEKRPRARIFVVAVAACCLLGLIWQTRVQTRFWHDSKTLFQHASDVTARNFYAETNLGLSLEEEGDQDGAMQHYSAALAMKPNSYYSLTLYFVGALKFKQGQAAEAARYFYQALGYPSTLPEEMTTRQALAAALERTGDWKNAEEQYRKVIKTSPATANGSRLNLGGLLVREQRYAEAVPFYQEVLKAEVPEASMYYLLGVAQQGAGDLPHAAASFREALRLEPTYIQAEQKLKAILAVQGNLDASKQAGFPRNFFNLLAKPQNT